MSASPFDHPFLSALLGDDEIAPLFSAEADIAAMLAFEAKLADACAVRGLCSPDAAAQIRHMLETFKPDMRQLREDTAKDGVVVPGLVRQMRAMLEEPARTSLHLGATSQDLIDTSLSLRIADVLAVFARRLYELDGELEAKRRTNGNILIRGRTRMQYAKEIPLNRRVEAWHEPVRQFRRDCDALRKTFPVLHFGGSVGTLQELGKEGSKVRSIMAGALGAVIVNPQHNARQPLVALASWLSIVSGTLGKLGQDVAIMAMDEVGEIKLSSGGGSSAMPHKVNPVGAEILVTLARFNATLLGGMHQSLVHENERSGAAWTLEWMLLPQMVMATGAALRTAIKLIGEIEFTGK